MNAGRFRSPSSDSAPTAPYDVNKFASPLSPLDFLGAGQRRTAADIAAEAAERLQDAETLRRLAAQGIDARLAAQGDLTPVDLATMGEMVGLTTPELRRLPVFMAQTRREQLEARQTLDDWLASRTHLDRAEKRLIHARLRPLSGVVQLNRLREEHRQSGQRLSRCLDYARRIDEGFVCLAVATHHRPFDAIGSFIDLHHHLIVEIDDNTDIEKVVGYLSKHFDVWIENGGEGDAEDPGGLAHYIRWSSARYVSGFSDENLAEYVRQTRGLHRYQVLGPLRQFVSQQRAIKTLHYRPARQRTPPGVMAAGPAVVAIRSAWIGCERRPVVLVRNWRGDWNDLAARYDLDLAVAAARTALERGSIPLSFPADTPESPQITVFRRGKRTPLEG